MSLYTDVIAYYALDGNCRDSANAHDGVAQGVTFTSGKIDKCAQVSSYTQYITLPDEVSVRGKQAVSYSTWIKLQQAPSTDFYVISQIGSSSGHTRAAVGVTSGLLPFMGARTVATGASGSFQRVTATTAITTGAWHFLCAVFDLSGGSLKLYLNGAQIGTLSVTASSFIDQSPQRLHIFQFDNYGTGNVFVDQVGIWSKSLSAEQVAQLYNDGSGLTYPFQPSVDINTVYTALDAARDKLIIQANAKGAQLSDSATLYQIADAMKDLGGTSAFESDAMAIIGTPTGGGDPGGGDPGGDIEPISQKYMTVTSTNDVGCGVGIEFTGTIQIVEDGVATLYTTSPISNIALRNATVYGDNITYFNCGSTNLASVDPSHNDQLVTLICSNGYLTALDVSNNPLLTTLEANSNNLSSAVVDKILNDLVAHGKSNGLLRLENSAGIGAASNGAPTSQSNVTTLQSRGWTVTTA